MRQIKFNNEYEIAYGRDHAVGLFIQVFDQKRKNDEDEGLVLDMDEMSNPGLTVEKIMEIGDEYGIDLRYASTI